MISLLSRSMAPTPATAAYPAAGPAVKATRQRHYLSASDVPAHDLSLTRIHEDLRDHVLAADYPCVAARSAFNRDNYRLGSLPALGTPEAAEQLWQALLAFGAEFPSPSNDLVSYVAVFSGPKMHSEYEFEALLWRQLQALHRLDAEHFGWAENVSDDPGGSDFSFSVGGRAFFIVGMHPQASRLARRTPRPMLVFNLHEQFEALRERGKYEGMKNVIRERDIALQGSINPVLARFGESSEARQYAGRAVPADWQCPFHAGSGAQA